jgi:hypothetical protein
LPQGELSTENQKNPLNKKEEVPQVEVEEFKEQTVPSTKRSFSAGD